MAKSKSPTLKFVLGALFGCVFALVAIYYWDRSASGLRYTVQFEDVKGLERGAPVQLQGKTVGEVTSVEYGDESLVDVALLIEPRYSSQVFGEPNSSARIHREGIVFRSAFVEIVNRGDGGEPLRDGAVIRGLDGTVDELVWRGGAAVSDASRSALEAGKVQLERLDQWAETDGAEMKAEVEAYLESLGEAASAAGDEARVKSELAMQKGRELLQKLQSDETKAEAAQAAEDVKAAFSGWLASAKDIAASEKERLEAMMEAATEEEPEPEAPAEEPSAPEPPATPAP